MKITNCRKSDFVAALCGRLLLCLLALLFLLTGCNSPASVPPPDTEGVTDPVTDPDAPTSPDAPPEEDPVGEEVIPNRGVPTQEVQAEIAEAYYLATGKQWEYVCRVGKASYYGAYGYSYVIFDGSNDRAKSSLWVANRRFAYDSSFDMYVYRRGALKGFLEAYNSGWLTVEQVEMVWDMHRATNAVGIKEAYEKEGYYVPSQWENFVPNQLFVVLKQSETYVPYTPQSFPEIDCIGVTEMISTDEDGQMFRVLLLTISGHSKEKVILCIRKLWERDDVHFVGANYEYGELVFPEYDTPIIRPW